MAQIINILQIVKYKHLNVALIKHSMVGTFEGFFESSTFVYALTISKVVCLNFTMGHHN